MTFEEIKAVYRVCNISVVDLGNGRVQIQVHDANGGSGTLWTWRRWKSWILSIPKRILQLS